MKKILILLVACTTITATAQRGNRRMAQNHSAEEIATLQTKKMTLALALDDSQSKQVYALNLEQAKKRKAIREEHLKDAANNEISKEDRFKRQNDMLDARIAVQNKMKTILNEDQFKQWRKMSHKRRKGKRPDRRNHRRRK